MALKKGKSQIIIPPNMVAVFPRPFQSELPFEKIDEFISKSDGKRPWFEKIHYKCLPLSIGNQYGFVIKSEFDFSVVWHGGDEADSVVVTKKESDEKTYSTVESHFGFGTFTIQTPFYLRTAPQVNLMTLPPLNYLLPNITVLCGVIETDNLRRDFTLNFRLEMPELEVFIEKGAPLVTILPIPRYFADSFELIDAKEIIPQELFDQEIQATKDTFIKRRYEEPYNASGHGRDYFMGRDVYGNLFDDHQFPQRNKKTD